MAGFLQVLFSLISKQKINGDRLCVGAEQTLKPHRNTETQPAPAARTPKQTWLEGRTEIDRKAGVFFRKTAVLLIDRKFSPTASPYQSAVRNAQAL